MADHFTAFCPAASPDPEDTESGAFGRTHARSPPAMANLDSLLEDVALFNGKSSVCLASTPLSVSRSLFRQLSALA